MREATPSPSGKPATPPTDGRSLALEVARLALEKKAEDPVVVDVRGLTSYADFFVLLSGGSNRQVAAVADGVTRGLRDQGHRPLGSEGAEGGHWILVDYGDVVVHVMQEDARAFYDLDGLWADAPRVPVPGAPPPRGF